MNDPIGDKGLPERGHLVTTPDLTKLKDYEYPEIAKRFYRDTQDHELEIVKDDGVHRHLRMRKPGDSSYWYEIVTWPGRLAFSGDGESFVFSRLEDMFEFFRSGFYGDQIHINASYWAEKLTSDRESVHRYQMDLFETALNEQVDQIAEDMAEDVAKRFREAVEDMLQSEDYSTMDAAIGMLDRFEFYSNKDDEYDYKKSADITFDDPWEWVHGCKDYEWWFLWALYGIVKAIHEYDKAKAETAVEEAGAEEAVPA